MDGSVALEIRDANSVTFETLKPLLFSVCSASMPLAMTDYHLKSLTTLPSLASQEAHEKRRKQLEAVRARRKIIYQRFRKHMQEQEKRVDPYQTA